MAQIYSGLADKLHKISWGFQAQGRRCEAQQFCSCHMSSTIGDIIQGYPVPFTIFNLWYVENGEIGLTCTDLTGTTQC